MSSEEVNEVKNEEAPEVVANEIIETTNEDNLLNKSKKNPKKNLKKKQNH